MKIDILCSSPNHPVNPWLETWKNKNRAFHDVNICRDKAELSGGDLLYLVSCTQIIKANIRSMYDHCLVLHASDLPKGRGWSPHIWTILEGAEEITLSLLDAEDKVDSGDIWAKRKFKVDKSALYDEINCALFEAEMELMSLGVVMIEKGQKPTAQIEQNANYYPKRTPKDSEIDPTLPLETQFDKIRVADPKRFPAFFRLFGQTYSIEIKKAKPDA